MSRHSVRTGMQPKRATVLAVLAGCSIALASCASSPSTQAMYVAKSKPSQSKEYFAEAEYGVKASPRVIQTAAASSVPGLKAKRLPRGGGRAQVGKPYKVKGKWYTPRLDPDYEASGTASWYGDAFHGRLTANGEIYDMNHLSAAHPTMPLPSYARVTNLKNGNSVIVRVNDRGPYAHNRLVDLSKRAAQLLDYTHSGTAQVKLEYVGPAPVNGADDDYLMASYQPGSGGLPANTGEQPIMVASAQIPGDPALPGVNAFANDIPQTPVAIAVAAPTAIVKQPRMAVAQAAMLEPMSTSDMPSMPAMAPTPAERPSTCIALEPCEDDGLRGMVNGYASERVQASHAAEAFRSLQLDATAIVNWKQSNTDERILVGTFSAPKAKKISAALKEIATVTSEIGDDGSVELFAMPQDKGSMDGLLKKLWKRGYRDAFVIR